MTKEQTMKALQEIKDDLEAKGHVVLAIFLQGSQNYGLEMFTDEYMSDIDCKAFLLPTFEDLYYNKMISTTKETPYGLVDLKDIRKFVDLMSKANPSYIELLFTDYKIADDLDIFQYGTDLVNDRRVKIMRASYGMLTQKIKALKHPYPTIVDKIEKYGYDPKQLHHIVRLYYLIRDLAEGKKTYKEALHPEGEEKEFLMELKMGKFSLEEAEALAARYDAWAKKIVDEMPIEGTVKKASIDKISTSVMNLVETKMCSQKKDF